MVAHVFTDELNKGQIVPLRFCEVTDDIINGLTPRQAHDLTLLNQSLGLDRRKGGHAVVAGSNVFGVLDDVELLDLKVLL